MERTAAFLFDMDGLLLDTEQVALDSFLDVAVPRGRGRDDASAFFLTLVGTSTQITHDRLIEYLGTVSAAKMFAKEWRVTFQARLGQRVPIKMHVQEALTHLSDQGQRLAVVTSTHGDQARHHLERAGLLTFFERVTGGDEVSANKPDPAPYIETAAAMGVAPEACFAFEDSDRGITAAVRAGCRAVQIPDLRPLDQPLPDLGQLVAANMRDAMALLGQRFQF